MELKIVCVSHQGELNNHSSTLNSIGQIMNHDGFLFYCIKFRGVILGLAGVAVPINEFVYSNCLSKEEFSEFSYFINQVDEQLTMHNRSYIQLYRMIKCPTISPIDLLSLFEKRRVFREDYIEIDIRRNQKFKSLIKKIPYSLFSEILAFWERKDRPI